ncbi:guanidinobutyrase [Chromobacterium alkanivorans]|uniref:agmatinase n=1 Tax=Chromobacterium alkanivorans TaxID=1071719 RepID=UPI002168A485|nr:agmatinase [Chromobacterium alkanivorans]MCS3804827.1 guanidinobutyrase [Chromobacterium alkanivorans]MCS3819166.1 guanidinobutyrase [Chromobacterium alkanivorans]MCS3872976.1 guanidinobutyrase [Chromobacterium alkanivorans]
MPATLLNQPLSGNAMPRFGGVASMMRLPLRDSAAGLDAAFIGLPLDIGTSNRSGARFGPREIRSQSALLRPYNLGSGAAPFERLQVADLGDVATNPYSLTDSVARIEAAYEQALLHPVRLLGIGGDHTVTLPALRALARKHGPLGLVHVDAHADVNDEMFGERIAHGTTFRRAWEEGLLAEGRVVQIGLRGSGYSAADFDWSRQRGFRVVTAEQCWHRSLAPLMAEVRAQMGAAPVYLSFDIDGIDPAFAPGTGTPEVGGLSSMQALEIVRGCRGLDLVGGDLVEVSPPYDGSGNTALLGANLLFEMLCVLPAPAR